MGATHEIVVLDDGELDDVRTALQELGAEFAYYRKGELPGTGWQPKRLLVATASLATSLRLTRSTTAGENRPIWIAVVANDSRTQRSLLLQAGFDYLVRRPVHPSALSLLLSNSLFAGAQTRRVERYAVGWPVSYRVGLRIRRGTLIDLSQGGLRLLAHKAIRRGAKLSVVLPGELTRGQPLQLSGHVLRATRGEQEGEPSAYGVAVRFDRMPGSAKTRLKALLESLAAGPPSLPQSIALPARRVAGVGAKSSPSARSQRPARWSSPQRHPRAVYTQKAIVFGEREHVLVGRDLSIGGMRVDPHPGLIVGDTLQVALSTGGREEPLVVSARVLRNDGPRGIALRFESFEGDGDARLGAMLSRLPVIESLRPRDSKQVLGAASDGETLVFWRLIPRLLRLGRKS